MDKHTLRKVYLEKRKMLSIDEYQRRNLLLLEQLKRFFASHQFSNIHVFLPIRQQKEPDTFPFIKYLWENKPEVQVITSISDLVKPEMQHYKIDKQIVITPNKWGIPEPQNATVFPITEIDCVLTPMVVGSKSGHRIGYGKGYYDRFLEKCLPQTKSVGLSLAPLLDGDLYAETHDKVLGTMITPFEIVNTH
ncbi:5-formyltetrahydrofolate cyclo-ligase [Marivirga sp. S37H4]|uniref:5-formyltetrahydrofolate cyclo-ligase n=1 Tax=Marivirga aurantiaca TaxID=2802615 RepID=A0A935CAP0_9BACT|nr:5-formyltetrahydrofolate cyclo-ligase [Marivirga aurantiaca]MBK6266876.1 5-formyltetrahydrofolate cyclo-ligase [Marivirga aurantiaca]